MTEPTEVETSGLLADPAQTTGDHAPSEPTVPLDRGAHAPTEVGETRFRATSVEADTEQGMWYLNVLDEPVHHTTEGAPVNLDWTRDGTLIGVELLGRGDVPRPARCGCADAERLYDELEQAYVSACTERDALSLLLRGMARKLVAYRRWTSGETPTIHKLFDSLRAEASSADDVTMSAIRLMNRAGQERDQARAERDEAVALCASLQSALLSRLADLAKQAGKLRTAEWLRTCALLPLEEWPPAPAYKGPMVPAERLDRALWLWAEAKWWLDQYMHDVTLWKRQVDDLGDERRRLQEQVAAGHRVQLAVAGQWLHHAAEEVGDEAGADYLTRLGEWLTDGTEGDEPKLRAALQGDQPTDGDRLPLADRARMWLDGQPTGEPDRG